MRLLQQQKRTPCPNWFFTFLLLSWLHQLVLTGGFFALGQPAPAWNLATLFHLAASGFYSLLYLLPMALTGFALRGLTHSNHLLKIVAVYAISVIVLLLLRMDLLVYELYAFHFNGFVWNLILTPGGIDSLGSSASTLLSIALLVAQIMLVQAIALFISRRGLLTCWRRNRSLGWATVLMTSLFLVQGTFYGISDLRQYGPVLDGSKAYPLFQRVRFRSLAEHFGYEREQQNNTHQLEQSQAALHYPLNPPAYTEVETPPNIIMLVAESLRQDQLSPTTMPNTWHFSENNLRFDQHYSSGNGTREALFGLFYGLYGSYWEQFMHARQSPLLMDRIQQLGYELDIRTSATFTYPEFDKTLFAAVPAAVMHTADETLPPWQRDEENMDGLLQFLQQRDRQRPFMSFYFLESTHASYSFPASSALHKDYQQEIDYMKLRKEGLAIDAQPLLNRYRNAGHWIDEQLGRLYAELEQQGLLDSTIVIVTGDHGEEFMEKGAWGHNSTFVAEQVRVPLVVHIPGQTAAIIDRPTSHLDIATTLLQQLGLTNAVDDYSLGRSLLDASHRDHLVLSDWHSIGIVTPTLKYRIPYLQSGVDSWPPTNASDQLLPADNAAAELKRAQPLILHAMRNFTRYTAARVSTRQQ